MSFSYNFKGCKAFVHGSKGEMLIANTLIQTYDSERLLATITGHPSKLKENDKVSVLIIGKSFVYEFQGTVRKMDFSGNQELALFRGTEKEDRKSVRYRVNIPASIECLLIGKKLTPLSSPETALIKDISKSGILIELNSKIFNVGTEFQIKLNINGSQTRLNACVKRVVKKENSKFDFGCALTGKV